MFSLQHGGDDPSWATVVGGEDGRIFGLQHFFAAFRDSIFGVQKEWGTGREAGAERSDKALLVEQRSMKS